MSIKLSRQDGNPHNNFHVIVLLSTGYTIFQFFHLPICGCTFSTPQFFLPFSYLCSSNSREIRRNSSNVAAPVAATVSRDDDGIHFSLDELFQIRTIMKLLSDI